MQPNFARATVKLSSFLFVSLCFVFAQMLMCHASYSIFDNLMFSFLPLPTIASTTTKKNLAEICLCFIRASAIFHFNKTLAFSFANNLHTTNSDNSEFSSLSEVLHCDWKNLKQQRASSPRIVAKTIYFCNCNLDSSIINQRRTESVPKPDSASRSIQMEMIILQWNCYLSLYISSFNCLHHSDSTFVQTPNWIWWK